jgi:hypothetical protein
VILGQTYRKRVPATDFHLNQYFGAITAYKMKRLIIALLAVSAC